MQAYASDLIRRLPPLIEYPSCLRASCGGDRRTRLRVVLDNLFRTTAGDDERRRDHTRLHRIATDDVALLEIADWEKAFRSKHRSLGSGIRSRAASVTVADSACSCGRILRRAGGDLSSANVRWHRLLITLPLVSEEVELLVLSQYHSRSTRRIRILFVDDRKRSSEDAGRAARSRRGRVSVRPTTERPGSRAY